MFHFPIAIFLFLLIHEGLFAQTSTYRDGGTKRIVSWNEFVGEIVTVDGLAWGANANGLGQHLILPLGRVDVHDIDYLKHDLNGRLLRVSGFLRKSRVKSAPLSVQGSAQSFDHFMIEAFAVERIDQVHYDQLLPSTFDWSVTGGKTKESLPTLHRLNYQEVQLALTPKKGSTPHAYRLPDNETLFFYDSKGRVESLARIKLNDLGKRDDERTPAKAIQLKSQN